MSEWYELEKDAVDYDFKEENVEILVCGVNFGNLYILLTFDEVIEIAEKVKQERTGAKNTSDNTRVS